MLRQWPNLAPGGVLGLKDFLCDFFVDLLQLGSNNLVKLTNDKDKAKEVRKTKAFREEHPQRATLDTCDL